MTDDEKQKGPEEGFDVETPDVVEPDGRTPENPEEVVDSTRKTLEEAQEENPQSITLDKLMKQWAASENPTLKEKFRMMKMLLMMMRDEEVNIQPGQVLVRKLSSISGTKAGEAHADFIEINEILFDKDFTADNLTILGHVMMHESLHLLKDIDNEGLTELSAADFAGDVVRDYKHLAQNVANVTSVLDRVEGDESGVKLAVRLYSEERYEDLYNKFVAHYDGDEDDAYKVFHLAFPELEDVDGGWQFNDEYVETLASDLPENDELSHKTVSDKVADVVDMDEWKKKKAAREAAAASSGSEGTGGEGTES